MSTTDQHQIVRTITVTEIPALGYGNPESKISYAKQMESGELTEAVAAYGAELIISGECMANVTEEDDGCIDGRPASEVLFINASGELETRLIDDASNHERSKVAGGGYMTTLAMKQALEGPGRSIDTDLASVATTLTEAGVYCGAHTGEHGHDEATDCGANDKCRLIQKNGRVFREEIDNTVVALLALANIETRVTVIDEVDANWTATEAQDAYFAGSTGVSRFAVIEKAIKDAQNTKDDFTKPVAVSKHLNGDHNEDFIVVNYVEGETFSQRLFAEKMCEKFPELSDEKLAQVFVVDVPRIVRLAEAFTAKRENAQEAFQTALYAGVKYQVATAATLTDGSLRNFIITE